MRSRGIPIVLLAFVACGKKVVIGPTTETISSDSAISDVSSEPAAMATDLASCLAECRVHSSGQHHSCLARTKHCNEAGAIFGEESACRNRCISSYGAALRCEACGTHIEKRECVYGAHLRCRWSLPERSLTLGCCLGTIVMDPPREEKGGEPCPSSGYCP